MSETGLAKGLLVRIFDCLLCALLAARLPPWRPLHLLLVRSVSETNLALHGGLAEECHEGVHSQE